MTEAELEQKIEAIVNRFFVSDNILNDAMRQIEEYKAKGLHTLSVTEVSELEELLTVAARLFGENMRTIILTIEQYKNL